MLREITARQDTALTARFQESAVAVCGLGGLGSNIAIALARAGVGRLLLYDFDRLEPSNLNRQQYFISQLGEEKSAALRAILEKIAPYCAVEAQTVKLTPENIPQLLGGADVICEAFDRADQKAMLTQTVLEKLPEKYLIAGSGVAGLSSANEIRTRRVTEHFYLCGDTVTDVAQSSGLYGARVGVCAAHQATMALRILAGEYDC